MQWLSKIGLGHHTPDEDGLFDGSTVPPVHNRYILAASILSVGSGIYAVCRRYYDLAPVPLGVFLTSINYWRNPTKSWRRTMDITYTIMSLVYQSIRAMDSEYGYLFYISSGIGILCYFISNALICHHSGLATLFHSAVHLFGNVGNVALYYGYVAPLAKVFEYFMP